MTPGASDANALAGRIAFSHEGDVYVMNADGSDRRRLTDHPELDFVDGGDLRQLTNDAAVEKDLDWSPDGSRLAFRTDRDGDEEIYVMAPDGTGQANLSRNPGLDWSPAWSHDGRQLAYFSAREGRVPSLYLAGLDGTDLRRLTGTEGGAYPSWSPDDVRLAYRQELPGNDEIFVLELATRALRNLTQHPANDYSPDWSPDGKSILFSRHGELYLMQADGSGQRPMVESLAVTGNFGVWGPCLP